MMGLPSPSLIHLSQGHLNLLEQCPRKFQHTYLDQVASPITLEQQQRMAWGDRFHLLMQQQELGLPLSEPANQEEAQIQQAMQGLLDWVPELLNPKGDRAFRQSEHRRTLAFQGYLLTVIYDLVILENDQGRIYDWKTYPRPHQRDRLAQDWQTRLYLFVLAETSAIAADRLSMTYWFVQSQTASSPDAAPPRSYTFPYSEALHQQTRQDLDSLLTQLNHWLNDYDQSQAFPQVPRSQGLCPDCTYSSRCQRHSLDEILEMQHPDWELAAIREVSL